MDSVGGGLSGLGVVEWGLPRLGTVWRPCGLGTVSILVDTLWRFRDCVARSACTFKYRESTTRTAANET